MSTRANRAAGAAALVAVSIMLSGCTIHVVDARDDRGVHMTGGPAPGDGVFGDADTTAISAADRMFALMMIPHHQQAIDMSELALATTTNTAVRDLATRIRDAQRQEIRLMEGWLDQVDASTPMGSGLPMPMPMAMGGMLTGAEMTELEHATGAEFDRLYLEGMITHHEGAIRMTRMILDSRNPDVRALGEAIVRSQTVEIEQMQRMPGR